MLAAEEVLFLPGFLFFVFLWFSPFWLFGLSGPGWTFSSPLLGQADSGPWKPYDLFKEVSFYGFWVRYQVLHFVQGGRVT